MENAEQIIKSELELYDEQQTQLEVLTEQLASNPQFAQFIEAQKSFKELESKVWKRVEEVMIDNNIKTIKTDKFTLTIAERTSFDIDLETLPKKFIKRVPDTTLIGGTYKLTGVPVKGTTPKFTKYLTKRIK